MRWKWKIQCLWRFSSIQVSTCWCQSGFKIARISPVAITDSIYCDLDAFVLKNKLIYHLFIESGWESHNNIIIKLKWLDSRCPILLLLHLFLSSGMFLDCYFMSQKPDAFWEVYSQRALQSSTDQHFKTVIHLLEGSIKRMDGVDSAGGPQVGHVIYITDSTNLVWTSSAESPSCSGSELATFACWVVVTVVQVWTLNIYEKKKKKTKDKKKRTILWYEIGQTRRIGGGSVTLFSLHVFFASCRQFFVRMLQN